MKNKVEINEGEILIHLNEAKPGKLSFTSLGLKKEDLVESDGFVRFVFDMKNISDPSFFQVPTIELTYNKNVAETHWQCDFNGTTIIDKHDNHGNSTIILLDRKVIEANWQHHENKLIMHAEFPEPISFEGDACFINLFK
ncbi:hypothetical protein DNU06_08650 [Putridiphycobacter roseus]|uniref:Uncharacterized protein n=1 Tax=Putridiphycobacter roseus TaxID=2219161 RepID=A0A2W1MYQ9_9FLAO|nr:hypothetical protein [Putridiphycobacter roseus]PZE17329.1 hypothetical protein DNU06_08650 [Putridiphycobacter roseus]